MSDESGGVPRLPTLLASREPERVGGSGSDVRATVLIAEGLPIMPLKLFEKIKRWEFVDLSLLLYDSSSMAEELLLQQRWEKVMIVQSVEQAQRRRKQITDIFSWSKAFLSTVQHYVQMKPYLRRSQWVCRLTFISSTSFF